jgi:hypothetical protein
LDARVDPVLRILALLARGIEPLPVVGSLDAFKRPDEDDWSRDLKWYAERIGPHIRMIQVLNEPDGAVTEEGASWQMSQSEANHWLGEARLRFPRPRFKLIGPGLVSGDPNWPGGLNLDLLDSLSPHPYAKEPASLAKSRMDHQHPRYAKPRYRYVPGDVTPEDRRGVASGTPVGPMLRGYQQWGLPLTITEYHSGTYGMTAYLRDFPGVELATVFCLHEYAEFGLIDHPEAAGHFLAAARGPTPMPSNPFPGYAIQAGFVAALQKHGYQPLSDERYFNEDMSVLLAEKGTGVRRLLLYNKRSNDVTVFNAAMVA